MQLPHVVQDILWVSGFQPRSHLDIKYLRPCAVWSPCYLQFQVHNPNSLLQLLVLRIHPDSCLMVRRLMNRRLYEVILAENRNLKAHACHHEFQLQNYQLH
jgi:hypothetical protein